MSFSVSYLRLPEMLFIKFILVRKRFLPSLVLSYQGARTDRMGIIGISDICRLGLLAKVEISRLL